MAVKTSKIIFRNFSTASKINLVSVFIFNDWFYDFDATSFHIFLKIFG